MDGSVHLGYSCRHNDLAFSQILLASSFGVGPSRATLECCLQPKARERVEEGSPLLVATDTLSFYGYLSSVVLYIGSSFSCISYTSHRVHLYLFGPFYVFGPCFYMYFLCMNIVALYCISMISRCSLLLFLFTNSTLNKFIKAILGIMYTGCFRACPHVGHSIFKNNIIEAYLFRWNSY